MAATLNEIETAALGLSPADRAWLVERLLDSLHGRPEENQSGPTIEELEARAEDTSSPARPWPVVRERLRRMLDP